MLVDDGSKQHARDTADVDVDVTSIRVGDGQAQLVALARQDGRQKRPGNGEAPEIKPVDDPHQDHQPGLRP